MGGGGGTRGYMRHVCTHIVNVKPSVPDGRDRALEALSLFATVYCTVHASWCLCHPLLERMTPNRPICCYPLGQWTRWITWRMRSVVGRIRTTPHLHNSPPYGYWSWWMVLFCGSGPSGELPWWGIVLGIMVLVGNVLGLIFIRWGIVLGGELS